MPEFKLNGKTYSGSTSYASAISYTEEDGSKTTVQDKISELYSRPVNNNLFINSNFINPVYQRPLDYYEPYNSYFKSVSEDNTIEYTIDRWAISRMYGSSPVVFSVKEGIRGIMLTGDKSIGDGIIYFGQAVENISYGTYTFSVNLNGEIYSTVVELKEEEEHNIKMVNSFLGFGLDKYYDNAVTAVIALNLNELPLQDGNPIANLHWAKLEHGEVATPYVPRLYAEELQLCKRYFKKWYNTYSPNQRDTNTIYSTHWFDDTDCGMCMTPHDWTLSFAEIYVNGIQTSGFTSEITNVHPNCVKLKHTKTSHGITSSDMVEVNMRVYLDAEF